ncbi:lysM and putative peptidoglycan-binding domain-containing protein 1 [Myripristis murdjan]|uniref:LysM and putative peptidoglycan-binding domain-containing protein 1 n=1 Tax=Myripristis murdjan TaxID=586833 RepID=A0A667Z7F5_9TELE|nr:lysM and putative peptidoglycan-binding domain-containing protein 1 [Myripristis murdjan]
MSGERAPLPAGGNSLLRGSRTRSYGSLVQSSLSPVRQRRIEHQVQPGETLQGLALRYGVSMEQIKRANRLYTNDSIFLKKSLSIPVLSDSDVYSNKAALAEEDSDDCSGCDSARNGNVERSPDQIQDEGEGGASELSPVDFLRRMDGLISQSKKAAVRGCQEGEKRFAALEAACSSRTPDRRRLTRSQSAISSSRAQQQASHVAVPLTIIKRTQKLKETEDEIFEL